jgi:hypothetical protein
MISGVLKGLFSEELQALACAISGTAALRQFLGSREEVHDVQLALRCGVITDDSVRRFSEQLLRNLKRGQLFPYDHTLAALAVALGDRYSPFAEEYLHGLAGLKAAEMPYSTRVARAVLSHRQSTTKVSWLDSLGNPSGGGIRVLDLDELSQRFPTRAKNQTDLIACNGI